MRLSLILVCAAGLSHAASVVYAIRPASGSRFVLKVDKTGLLRGKQHVFLFERYESTLSYDQGSPERSRVELSIEGASAVCQDTWVSESDRKKILNVALNEMLAVEKYSRLRFSSDRVTRTGEGSFEVEGPLTIRGIAKPVSVTVTVKSDAGRIVSFSGRAIVKLKDYGLKPPGAALGTIGTKNEMTVEFLLLPALGAGGSIATGEKLQ